MDQMTSSPNKKVLTQFTLVATLCRKIPSFFDSRPYSKFLVIDLKPEEIFGTINPPLSSSTPRNMSNNLKLKVFMVSRPLDAIPSNCNWILWFASDNRWYWCIQTTSESYVRAQNIIKSRRNSIKFIIHKIVGEEIPGLNICLTQGKERLSHRHLIL